MLLLDTHAWVWSVEADVKRVGRRARQLLSRAESRDSIHIATISLFEVTALHSAGRLRLTHPVEQWIRDRLEARGVRVADFSPTIAIDAGTIPRSALPDPIDRILVATARQLDATLLTADSRILEYAAATRSVRVQHAGR